MAESDIYLARGVSSSKEEIHRAIKNVDPGIFPGAFCKVLPDTLTDDPDYCLLMHADGAGTKSSLAYLYWKETGDLSVFKGIAVDSLVMNLDDLACVGAVDRFLLSNTIGRNKFHVPGEVVQTIIEGFEEAIASLAQHGIHIDFCGGETADVGDLVRTLIVDSTITTRMKKSRVIDLNAVQAGDKIVGFASFGQAEWETAYNSGIGSNGLTAARHDCFSKEYARKYPESYSADIPEKLVYCGAGKIETPLEGTPLTLGQAVLSPTRTYAPLIKKLLQLFPEQIHGMVHCTGGGQTKCLKFGQGIHYVKDDLFPEPPVFSYIRNTGGYGLKELFPVYNMGHRLEIFADDAGNVVAEMLAVAREFGIEARLVGYCEKSDYSENRLTIKHDGETIHY
ncbi:MAG: phosphoribosylformylglycinamidine cyclo-ligase [Proteobacteria bacterium]|nr:phosphoribosylformylglycinamidine cyclo-ligase [Pseudomonadota bacterium]